MVKILQMISKKKKKKECRTSGRGEKMFNIIASSWIPSSRYSEVLERNMSVTEQFVAS